MDHLVRAVDPAGFMVRIRVQNSSINIQPSTVLILSSLVQGPWVVYIEFFYQVGSGYGKGGGKFEKRGEKLVLYVQEVVDLKY